MLIKATIRTYAGEIREILGDDWATLFDGVDTSEAEYIEAHILTEVQNDGRPAHD